MKPLRASILQGFAKAKLEADTWHTTIRCQAEQIDELKALCERAADELEIESDEQDAVQRKQLITALRKAAK
jgi:hypothetical protein